MKAKIVDGSFLEGGGQILRLSAALSAILGVPIQVENVRKGRPKPGLRPQHLTGLKLVAQMCDAAVEGLEVGSTQIMISPGLLSWKKEPFAADAKTAGSCMLLAQVSLPPAMYLRFSPHQHGSAAEAPRKLQKSPKTTGLQLCGGTDASFAPPVGYMQHVFSPLMAKLQGLEVNVQTHRRGFAPKGGGEVTVEVPVLPAGACLPAFDLCHRGPIESVAIFSFSGGKESPDTAEAIAAGARAVLMESDAGRLANVEIICDTQHDPQALGAGSGVVMVAKSKEGALLGASCLGQRNRSPAATGRIAAQDLLREVAHGGCLDTWMQDQVIIFMALARGRSAYTTGNLTLHSITAITVVESLMPARFKLCCEGRELEGDGIRALGQELMAEGDGQGDYRTSMKARPVDSLWTVECVSPGIEKKA